MKNLILIAPPSAGKGTISEYLVNNYDYSHISTGDLLREEIKKNSEIGKEVKDIVSKGEFPRDELVFALLEDKMSKVKGSLIFDGIPRNIKQADMLIDLLDKLKLRKPCIIYLDVKKEELLKRVTGRRICPNCGRTYNVNFESMYPLDGHLCKDCKTALITRDDDNIETYNVRYQQYMDNTYPVIDYMSSKSFKVYTIDGSDLNNMLNEVEKIISEE